MADKEIRRQRRRRGRTVWTKNWANKEHFADSSDNFQFPIFSFFRFNLMPLFFLFLLPLHQLIFFHFFIFFTFNVSRWNYFDQNFFLTIFIMILGHLHQHYQQTDRLLYKHLNSLLLLLLSTCWIDVCVYVCLVKSECIGISIIMVKINFRPILFTWVNSLTVHT